MGDEQECSWKAEREGWAVFLDLRGERPRSGDTSGCLPCAGDSARSYCETRSVTNTGVILSPERTHYWRPDGSGTASFEVRQRRALPGISLAQQGEVRAHPSSCIFPNLHCSQTSILPKPPSFPGCRATTFWGELFSPSFPALSLCQESSRNADKAGVWRCQGCCIWGAIAGPAPPRCALL